MQARDARAEQTPTGPGVLGLRARQPCRRAVGSGASVPMRARAFVSGDRLAPRDGGELSRAPALTPADGAACRLIAGAQLFRVLGTVLRSKSPSPGCRERLEWWRPVGTASLATAHVAVSDGTNFF